MAEYTDREHYIPLRKSDLIELLAGDKQLSSTEQQEFRQFCTILSALFHFEYLDKLEMLKDSFAPFDPDAETKPLRPIPQEERDRRLEQLFTQFIELMAKANYTRLTKEDVVAAMEAGASDWGINMDVDWTVFEPNRVVAFFRGDGKSTRTRRHWLWFWKEVDKQVDTYKRFVLMVKLQPHKRLGKTVDTKGVYIKVFKDIPKLDLEMMFPGAQIMMPGTQKMKLGGSLVGTMGYGIFKVWSEILMVGATLAKGALLAAGTALWAPLVLLGGYGYKQYAGWHATKQQYVMQLTESLYYLNLGNNMGVMTHIIDEAEEQECREAMLAYYCLWKKAPPEGWSTRQLDDYVEMFLEGAVNLKVDFEVADAMEKVLRLGLVEKVGEKYKAVPIQQALERLDHRWDNYFQYNKG